MKIDRGQLYQRLYDAYRKAHPEKNGKSNQVDVNSLWLEFKNTDQNITPFSKLVENKILYLHRLATSKKTSSTLFRYLTSNTSLGIIKKKKVEQECNNNVTHEFENNDGQASKIQNSSLTEKTNSTEKINEEPDFSTVEISTPVQDKIKKNISVIERRILDITRARDAGLDTEEDFMNLKKLKTKLHLEQKKLRVKKSDIKRQKKRREAKKMFLLTVCKEHPEYAKKFGLRNKVGRPRVEDDQENLLEIISDLAIFGGAVDDRRRTELIRSCKTLDELIDELKKLGFEISRSALYLRLLPRNSKSHEGKRHVKTVPVKLCRSLANQHRNHQDTDFCRSTIQDLETISSILGPNQVCFISQDDKARVPLGITAAHKQAHMLMHLEYKVTLPDHDWVVAECHKLIPSVYAGIVIKPDGNGDPSAVTYSGPTYVAIRSGKHSSSTADSHAKDFNRLLELPEFDPITKKPEGSMKPVAIFTVDGGPDENPRYQKVIANAIQHFKDLNLDVLIIATNAPGRSAYNRVERRMAPMSKELSGIVLPYDHFGSHLDAKRQTIDSDLEMRNFKYAGEVLSEVWSSMVIDDHSVTAEYIEPETLSPASMPDMDWYCQHVREAQYVLQIVKCDNINCCGKRRSNWWTTLPSGFLLLPYPIVQASKLKVPLSDEYLSLKFSPLLLRLTLDKQLEFENPSRRSYDMHCPSVKTRVSSRTCKICGLYHASNKSALNHAKAMHKKVNTELKKVRPERIAARRARELLCIIKNVENGDEDAEWLEESDVECNSNLEIPTEGTIPVINSIKSWVVNPWTAEDA